MRGLRPFALERFFGRWEFAAPHALSSSDCEPLTVHEVLTLAGAGPEVLLEAKLGYVESDGQPFLRERIASFYPGLSPDDVLVFAAPEEAIFVAMSALVGPGERVIVQTPCYQSLAEVARAAGAEVVGWPLVEREADWACDLDALERELARRPTALLVVNAPHNPTGWQPDAATWQAIVALAARHGARVFADEMYRGLERRSEEALVPAACIDDRALSLWGMSKSFGLAGLRIGWLALRDRALRQRMLALKDYTTICAAAPSELLASLALGAHALITARHRVTIEANLEIARDFAARAGGTIAWREPRAGSVAFPRWVAGGASALAERMAREHGLVIVSSDLFDHGDHHVRFGLGRRAFPEALAIFERALEAP